MLSLFISQRHFSQPMIPIPYLRLSSFYFFYFATVGGFVPYWSLYLAENGFNALQIGQLSALLVGTKIIAPNIWGYIADKTGKSLPIIRLATVFSAVFFASFLIIHGYWQFMLITMLFSFFWNAALPQLDAVTLAHLHGKTQDYSRIRLWGSVGFIVAVQGVGWLLESYSISQLPLLITGCLIALWLVSLITPEAASIVHHNVAESMRQIVMRPEVLAFCAVSILLQMAHAPYYVFYSIYLKSFGFSASSTGLLWALGVVAEIILFIYMAKVLKWFSLRHILLFGIVSGIGRWLIVAYFGESWQWQVCTQVLHASSFGAVHIGSVLLIQQYFGTRHASKGQALYNSLSYGLGGMLGSMISGHLWAWAGGVVVYSGSALCCAVALWIAYRWIGKAAPQNLTPQSPP